MKKEAIEVLMNRRAVRKFKSEQITDEQLQSILEVGTYAPTGRHRQTPWIIAVQNPEEREAVSKLNAKVMGADTDPYYGAPTIVIVVAPEDGVFGNLNGAAVITNMVNAAYAVGVDSCWIHRPLEMFRTEEGKAMLKKWGITEDVIGIGSIALGYADMPVPAASPRKENYYRIIK